MGLDGVEVFTNSSGSHWTLRKLGLRLQLIQEATRKSGGVYIYSNEVCIPANATCPNSSHANRTLQQQAGGSGDRLFFDASAMVSVM